METSDTPVNNPATPSTPPAPVSSSTSATSAPDGLSQRIRKLLHNEALLNQRVANQARPFDEYLQLYVDQVVACIAYGRPCLLTGALGSGKTQVMLRAEQTLATTLGLHCIYINAGDYLDMTPRILLRLLARSMFDAATVAEAERQFDTEGRLRELIARWIRDNHRDVVLLLDQVELLDYDQDVLRLIRALYQLQQDDEDSAQFLAVLSSTQSLRNRLAGETSPLHNILQEVTLRDCDANLRRLFWARELAVLRDSAREALIKQLDIWCDGDPYQMTRMAAFIHTALEDEEKLAAQEMIQTMGEQLVQVMPSLTSILTGASDTNDPNEEQRLNRLSRRVTYAISDAQNEPEKIAPLLIRYAELMDDDIDALTVLLRLAVRDRVSVREMPERHEGRTAILWGGVFALRGGYWTWRSHLTEVFMLREFLQRPNRLSRSLRRKQKFEDALIHIRRYKDFGALALPTLIELVTDWIRTAELPSAAWGRLARTLMMWFDSTTGASTINENKPSTAKDAVQVYRFYAYRPNTAGEYGDYFRVLPDGRDSAATPDISRALHRAFLERLNEAAPNEIAQRPYRDAILNWHIFPLIKDRSEFGAVVWSAEAFDEEMKFADRRMMHVTRWVELLSSAAAELVKLQEREVLREEVATSLKIQDYALIENEYAHQWNKRIRKMRNFARHALEALDEGGDTPTPTTTEAVRERLQRIEQVSDEALERLRFNSKFYETETVPLKQWLDETVQNWNLLHGRDGIDCEYKPAVQDSDTLTTRPILLDWILRELLTNAQQAESGNKNGRIVLVVRPWHEGSANASAPAEPADAYEISIYNPTPIPRHILQALASDNPLERPNRSGHGIWIARGQVRVLLGGKLLLPPADAPDTVIKVIVPKVSL